MTAPAADDTWPIRRRPGVVLVRNPEDGPAAAKYLPKIGDLDFGRVLVQPTPGARTHRDLALDILTALGKNPVVIHRDSAQAWTLVQAWLAAQRPTDLLLDRAHLLPPDLIADTAAVCARVGTCLWLIWSGQQEPDDVLGALETAGHPAETRRIDEIIRWDLPVPPWHTPKPPPAPNPIRPMLPTADFPLFLAAARRHLTTKAFDTLAPIYHTAGNTAETWLRTLPTPLPADRGPFAQQVTGPLIWWLRDTQIGPLSSGYDALITLRATQAAAARRGILLTWDRKKLGLRPENKLPGVVTLDLCSALRSLARTEDAAATVLSLHLNQGAACFGCWNLSDIAADGATLSPAGEHRHWIPRTQAWSAWPSEQIPHDLSKLEIACQHPIRLPPQAATFIRAHLTLRRNEGAGDHDAFFSHPVGARVTTWLNLAIKRAARHVNQDPWWVDRQRINERDLGRRIIHSSWLTERGLAIFWPPHPAFANSRPPRPDHDEAR